ncbi:MAG: hypothetical protein HYX47_09410 [Burkholderiales bacterium]|nr:hypothetical protein [Burkholderiales bacterium]
MNHLNATEGASGLRIPALTADYIRLALLHLREVAATTAGCDAPSLDALARILGPAGSAASLDADDALLLHQAMQDMRGALPGRTAELEMVEKIRSVLPAPPVAAAIAH